MSYYNNPYGNYYNPYLMNPMLNQQNRLQNMEMQQLQQQNQMQSPVQNNYVLKGRPVTSFDEAKASMIDLDGSVYVFPDFANGKIYTKQINLDGTAALNTYSLENPNMQITENNISVSDMIANRLNSIEEKLMSIENEVKNHVQSVSNVSNDITVKKPARNVKSNIWEQSRNAESATNDTGKI